MAKENNAEPITLEDVEALFDTKLEEAREEWEKDLADAVETKLKTGKGTLPANLDSVIESKVREIVNGGTVKAPKLKPDPDFNKDNTLFKETYVVTETHGTKSFKTIRVNKVMMMPTKENSTHEQGKEFLCKAPLANQLGRKGTAIFVRMATEEDIEALHKKPLPMTDEEVK